MLPTTLTVSSLLRMATAHRDGLTACGDDGRITQPFANSQIFIPHEPIYPGMRDKKNYHPRKTGQWVQGRDKGRHLEPRQCDLTCDDRVSE